MYKASRKIYILYLLLLLTSCTYNPFAANNHTTGSPLAAGIGAGVGVGTMSVLGGSKNLMVAAGVTGGLVGYYVSTLRYDSGGVIQGAGKVYTIGQYMGIYIPNDKLFEPNTAELLPQAPAILDSAAVVLQRYPNNNIIISGNGSGFGRRKWEQKLSEQRAAKVAAYLWQAGINNFKDRSIETRKLNYVGYGDYFPIATHLTNKGLRQNSRIQITSYPSNADLHINKDRLTSYNIGAYKDPVVSDDAKLSPCGNGKYQDNCYSDN